LICDYIDPGDAYHLALTCTTFLEPGLDKVWWYIEDFEPLISCIPAHWVEEKDLPFDDSPAENIILVSPSPLAPQRN
jgi:hypothetical protein